MFNRKNNQQLKNNIWKIYLYKILTGMFFSIPVMVLFWQDNGLSLTEIMILQSIFSIFTVILEIPTGYFSDMHGRKKSLVLAGLMSFVGIVFYSLGHNFYHFLFAEIFFALHISLHSGTLSAFAYDTLQDLGKEKKYKQIWGNAFFYGLIALSLSNVIGGFIAVINLRYTLFASIPFFALLIPVTLSMKEPKKHKLIIKKGYTKELIKILKISLIDNKKLRWIILYSGIVYAFNQASLWLYQPYLKLSGLDILHFGFVFASFQIVAAFSSKYAYKIEKKLGEKFSIVMMIFLVAGSFFLMSNFIYLFSFSFCFIHQFVRGYKNVIVTDYINKITTSNIRATVLSAESFISRLLYAFIMPFIGWIADVYNIVQALTVLGITSFVSGIIIILFLRKDKVI